MFNKLYFFVPIFNFSFTKAHELEKSKDPKQRKALQQEMEVFGPRRVHVEHVVKPIYS